MQVGIWRLGKHPVRSGDMKKKRTTPSSPLVNYSGGRKLRLSHEDGEGEKAREKTEATPRGGREGAEETNLALQ